MRRRWVYINGEAIEVSKDYAAPVAPAIFGDLPAYESPATGLMVEGRAARREDLKRSGCRPWEGLEQEKKEAAKQEQYIEQRREQAIDKAAWTAWYQMSPTKRRLLRGE